MSENNNMTEALSKVKTALRVTTDAFDDEILDLMESALLDLNIAEVNGEQALITDPLVRLAVITYCRLHFGEPDDFDRLKQSYDEQKAQLSMSTGYTVWIPETEDF